MSIFRKSVQKIQISLKYDKNNRYFVWIPIYCFFIVSRSVLLIMRYVSEKCYRENRNTHFMFNKFFYENRTVCEIMWKNIVKLDRSQMAIWRMRNGCWIRKAIYTHSEYCFSTATTVARTRLSVMLYVLCLSCYSSKPVYNYALRVILTHNTSGYAIEFLVKRRDMYTALRHTTYQSRESRMQ
jgi:hypothetical protein